MAETQYTRQTVLARTEWVPGKLFSLRVTRPEGFEFVAGQFARLGLPQAGPGENGAPASPADPAQQPAPTVWRAYSMVSGAREPWLEFYSVVVPEGQFSPLLARLQEGDGLYVDRTAFGFLTLERFADGQDLWLIASGTGLSAYLSMFRDGEPLRRFQRVVLVHGVRSAQELAYRDQILAWQREAGTLDGQQRLVYLPIASRETLPGAPQSRITPLLADGRLEAAAGLALDPARSRIMLCGNPGLLADARALLKTRGFAPGRRGVPGNLAVENYW
ncbi:ferredoxin--NADP reductase [Orrella sp. JC864]|uniref:ferredoxin--NADP reductase n=1 Tax=Orrella sp. JC864 TaxID=3120298 RepID=UPI00300A00F3